MYSKIEGLNEHRIELNNKRAIILAEAGKRVVQETVKSDPGFALKQLSGPRLAGAVVAFLGPTKNVLVEEFRSITGAELSGTIETKAIFFR